MASDDAMLNADDHELLALLRTVEPADFVLEAPPASVWEGISAEVAKPVVVSRPTDVAVASTPLRRRLPRRALSIAASLVVLLGVGGFVVKQKGTDRNLVVAIAPLSSVGLEGAPAGLVGEADVVERNGHRYVRLKAKGVAPKSGEFLELWLIDSNVKGMVSLGAVNSTGEYELPSGLSVSDYPIVDLSTEPYDGKPTHSGASLLRGKLA
jgi:Anti-sigma-K factor rskA